MPKDRDGFAFDSKHTRDHLSSIDLSLVLVGVRLHVILVCDFVKEYTLTVIHNGITLDLCAACDNLSLRCKVGVGLSLGEHGFASA